jgi:signal peptidase II
MRKRIGTISITVIVIIILDQITKVLAALYLPQYTLRFLGDTVRLHYAENRGAFLSLGANLPENVRFLIFTIFSAVVLIIMLFYILFYETDIPQSQLVIWALMFGGGISNLIDRIFRNGLVRDFLNVGIGNVRTGVFNIADVALTGGVIVLVLQNLWMMKAERIIIDQTTPPKLEQEASQD